MERIEPWALAQSVIVNSIRRPLPNAGDQTEENSQMFHTCLESQKFESFMSSSSLNPYEDPHMKQSAFSKKQNFQLHQNPPCQPKKKMNSDVIQRITEMSRSQLNGAHLDALCENASLKEDIKMLRHNYNKLTVKIINNKQTQTQNPRTNLTCTNCARIEENCGELQMQIFTLCNELTEKKVENQNLQQKFNEIWARLEVYQNQLASLELSQGTSVRGCPIPVQDFMMSSVRPILKDKVQVSEEELTKLQKKIQFAPQLQEKMQQKCHLDADQTYFNDGYSMEVGLSRQYKQPPKEQVHFSVLVEELRRDMQRMQIVLDRGPESLRIIEQITAEKSFLKHH